MNSRKHESSIRSVRRKRLQPQLRQSGATVVEFALVAIIFLFLLIGITDLGRWLFLSNAASEAARLGARLAVVCDRTAWNNGVLRQMQQFVPQLQTANVTFESFPSNSCVAYGTASDTVCTGVSVTLNGLSVQPISPWIPAMPIFTFKVTLPRESMAALLDEPTGGQSNNTVCN